MKYGFFFFGALFGFLMSRAGGTTQDYYAQLFLFENLQLMWVIGAAVTVGIIGMALLKQTGSFDIINNQPLAFERKPMREGLAIGAILFGVGWGLTGACPGSVPAMLGEGKLMAAFTLLGILLGTYLYGLLQSPPREKATEADSPVNAEPAVQKSGNS